MAIYEACIFAADCGFDSGIIESDSKQAVEMLLNNDIYLVQGCFVIDLVRDTFHNCSFHCVFSHRETNMVAHTLAGYATHCTDCVV